MKASIKNQLPIGEGNRCFIIAEIGINHNGDTNLAIEMVDAAAEAGANCVKFQNYRTEDFISNSNLELQYISQGKQITERQFDLFKRCEINRDQLILFKERCDKKGVIFCSTPTGKEGVEDLVSIESPLLKNGSDFLQNHELLESMASSGLPTIISTGMATQDEILESVSAFSKAGGKDLFLLLCTSSYPAPRESINLRKIETLKNAFGFPVGFSDHSEGNIAAIGAIALGACILEKHFTINKHLPGPDHRFSVDPKEMDSYVKDVRDIEACLGNEALHPDAAEDYGRKHYRLSCASSRPLSKGQVVNHQDIVLKRPGTGIAPSAKLKIIGRKTIRDIPIGHLFSMSDLQ